MRAIRREQGASDSPTRRAIVRLLTGPRGADLKKLKKGKALSPVLLVRGNAATGAAMTVADGYHRICASWYKDENIPIACRIVSLPR